MGRRRRKQARGDACQMDEEDGSTHHRSRNTPSTSAGDLQAQPDPLAGGTRPRAGLGTQTAIARIPGVGTLTCYILSVDLGGGVVDGGVAIGSLSAEAVCSAIRPRVR